MSGELTNPFARHGLLRAARGQSYLAHADGTPFFFLADTAWSGPLRSSESDWQTYLADRKSKGFTAIQFILMAPWGGAYTDANGRTAFNGSEPDPVFFQRMDARIDAIHRAGLLPVPVLAWAAKFGASARHNPGVSWPTPMLERAIRFQVDRYGQNPVLWLLAGDGNYGGWRSWRWKRLGRKIFGSASAARAPVGLHPMGGTWPYARFRREAWLDLFGYQSGHAGDPSSLRWLRHGPPACAWRTDARPVINVEPCYEGIRNWAADRPFTAADVRRTLYASLLNAPTAGVSYGAHGVWSWEAEPCEPLNHPGSGIARPWHEAAQFPGSYDVERLAALFTSFDWWRLKPDSSILVSQPGDQDVFHYVSAAVTDERDLAVVYLPIGGDLCVRPASLPRQGFWFDPRTSVRASVKIPSDGRLRSPDTNDWLLVLQRGSV